MGSTYKGMKCSACESDIRYLDNDDCRACKAREKKSKPSRSCIVRRRIEEHQHKESDHEY